MLGPFSLLTLIILVSAIPGVPALSILALSDNGEWLSGPISAVDLEDGGDAQFAVWGNNVYLVWDANGVMFAKSNDTGISFSEPVTIGSRHPDSSVGLYPAVAAYGDNVYVLYSSGLDIFLLKSEDGGVSFGEPLNISRTNIDYPYSVTEHVISIDDPNHVYVSWAVYSGNWSEVYFAQSSDSGKTFGEPKNISDSPDQPSQLPRIASSGNQVCVVWYDIDEFYGGYHVSFAGSSDGGETFQRINNLSANSGAEFAFEPGVAIGNDVVYVTWRDNPGDGAPKINLAKSTDSGSTFQFKKGIAVGGWPALAVQRDNVYIAFGVQDNNSTDNVAFVGSLDGGKTFGDPIMLSNHTWGLDYRDERAFPRIAADGANVYVGWRYTASSSSNHETFLAASYDEGRTFATQLNLSQNQAIGEGNTAYQPALVAVPVDRIFVLWLEYAEDKATIMLTRGQIPEIYTEPFREQVEAVTPVVLYEGKEFLLIGVVGAGIAGIAVFLALWKRKKK